MGDVPALQDEASIAAVVNYAALYRLSWGLHCHPAILQRYPCTGAQQHWSLKRGRGSKWEWNRERDIELQNIFEEEEGGGK